jgi:hypothetical protein
MAERKWSVRLGAVAELDFANIIKWIAKKFRPPAVPMFQFSDEPPFG